MPTTKRRGTPRGDPTKHWMRSGGTSNQDVLGRVAHAVEVLEWSAASQRKILASAARTDTLSKLLRLAEQLKIDPRWLATGLVSRAGAAAADRLRDNGWQERDIDEGTPIELMRLLVEPDLGPGICRYCLCTDEYGCGDCEWVDPARTICSSCLDVEERK